LIMLGPSLKSVPGCLVSIVPIGIGVPVAATPGFLPHAEMLDELLLAPALALVLVLVLVALDPPLAAVPALVVLLLLLPHAARSIAAPTSPASANARTRTPWRSLLTSVLLLEMDYVESAPVWRGAHVIGARTCMQHRPNQT
jgi:hypothetical protein